MAIRWGILGCGDVCEVKSGPGFQKAAGSALTMVMRRHADRCADYARRHNVPHWTTDADELIHSDDVDAVYVATPAGSHCDYALRVAAAGKSCYVEKPMARSHAECQRMIEAFKLAGVPLYVGFYRRALPRFLKVKELLDEGTLGTITAVSYRLSAGRHRKAYADGQVEWRLTAEQGGGGLLLDLGSHTLDILDFLLGPIEAVAGDAARRVPVFDVEDSVAMQFRFASGVLGTAMWNFASAVGEDIIEITGSDGRVTISTFETEPIRLRTASGEQTFDIPNPPHVHQPLIQTIVDELQGKGTCPSTGESGARTAWVMDAALKGYYGGRDDAFWSRPDTWPGRAATPTATRD